MTAYEPLDNKYWCIICYQYVDLLETLKCNHQFCSSCLNEWFNDHESCPLCRAVHVYEEWYPYEPRKFSFAELFGFCATCSNFLSIDKGCKDCV
jgi:hypothetical protein